MFSISSMYWYGYRPSPSCGGIIPTGPTEMIGSAPEAGSAMTVDPLFGGCAPTEYAGICRKALSAAVACGPEVSHGPVEVGMTWLANGGAVQPGYGVVEFDHDGDPESVGVLGVAPDDGVDGPPGVDVDAP